MELKETFSSKLVNYTESHEINGELYTKIFTELNTELTIGDSVYIFGGNFDNSSSEDTSGYKILSIDKNSIVIDKLYTEEKPYNEDLLENYTKVYVVDDLDKFNYENQANNFGLEANPGGKYSPENNSIFLSKIENLPFTDETQTDGKFFISKEDVEPSIKFKDTKGQLINDSTSLNFELKEVEKYGLTSSVGLTGSSQINLQSGFNNVDDIVLDKENDGLFSISSNNEGESNLFSFAKNGLFSNNSKILDNKAGNNIKSNTITNLDTTSISISGPNIPQNPIDNYTFNEYYYSAISQGGVFPGNITSIDYEILNDFNTLILGFSQSDSTNNLKSFGFYSSKQTNLIPVGYFDTPFGYDSSSYETDSEIDPYFVLSNYQSSTSPSNNYVDEITGGDLINFGFDYSRGFRLLLNSGLDYKEGQFAELKPISSSIKGSIIIEVISYDENTGELESRYIKRGPNGFGETEDYTIRFYSSGNDSSSNSNELFNTGNYFPVSESSKENHFNILPYYAEFSGIGSPVKSLTNEYQIDGYSNNLELCFAGMDIPEGKKGGLYFYSYAGCWVDDLTLSNTHMYLGNAFDFSESTFDKYNSNTGKWKNSKFNPFENVLNGQPITDYSEISNIKDVIFLGVEKKELGLGISYDNQSVKKGTNEGLYYSKYLVVNTPGGGFNTSAYFIYLNYDSNLLFWNEEFRSEVANLNIPQVHVVIEKLVIDSEFPTTIGKQKNNNSSSVLNLDGKYPIDSLDKTDNNTSFSIPLNQSIPDFDDVSISNIHFEEDRWVLSSSSTSPRFSHPLDNIQTNSSGVILYDKTITDDYKELKLNNQTTIDIGETLPTNEVFKAITEEIQNVKRIWAATPKGIFLFEYSLEYDYNYYRSIDFDSNEIPSNDNIFFNNKIYIEESFEYDGIEFEKGKVYKYSNQDNIWVEDLEYTPSILSKSHFRGGDFTSGTFNDGFFGDNKNKLNWNGPEFRHGIFYNSVWNNGEFGSKSSKVLDKTFSAKLNGEEISFSSSEDNNNSFGYNYFLESFFKKGAVVNGNFENSKIGEENQNNKLLDNIYQSNNFDFSEISFENINLKNSEIYSTILNNSTINNSKVVSSKFTENNKIISNNLEDTKIEDGIINQEGSVEIIGYDKWFNLKNELNGQKVIHSHKFFIKEDDFKKINHLDKIIFDKVEINSENKTNLLDNMFFLLSGDKGFYQEFYRDYNSIIEENGITTHSKINFEVFISKKTKQQNKTKFKLNYNESENDFDVIQIQNEEPLYSVDLNIVVDTIPYNSKKSRYLNSLKDDGVLKFSVVDTSKAVIQKNHILFSWINGGKFIGGSIITPEQLTHRVSSNPDILFTKVLKGKRGVFIELDDSLSEFKSDFILNNKNLYDLNENNPEDPKIVNLNNIWVDSFDENISGNFNIKFLTKEDIIDYNQNNPQNQIPQKNYWFLEPFEEITTQTDGEIKTPISQYIHVNTNRIDGENNELEIVSGRFKNQSFKNAKIQNDNQEMTDKFDYFNYRKLFIINSDISKIDKNKIGKSVLLNGYISSLDDEDFIEFSSTLFKQVVQKGIGEDSILISSALLEGELKSSLFTKSSFKDINSLLVINNKRLSNTETALLPVWHTGDFKSGEFRESIWMNGDFYNGVFLNSEFLNGRFKNGVFGDKNQSKKTSIFRKGIWEDGVFENGIFSDNSNFVDKIQTEYTSSKYLETENEYKKEGTNIWERGIFNNGIFSNIDGEVSLFKDGNFNNGEINGNVIWLDGSFNDGIFNSDYGHFISPVWGEVNLSNIGQVDSETISVDINQNLNKLGFLNKNNIASIREEQGDVFTNVGTMVLDTSSNKLKFLFVGDNSDPDQKIFTTTNSQHGYSEKVVSDSLGDTNKQLFLIFKSLDYLEGEKHPLNGSEIIGSRMYLQNTQQHYVFDGTEWVEENIFLAKNIKETNIPFGSVYAWRKGIFNGGVFGDTENKNNLNPSWEDGTFNGGDFYGKVWNDGVFLKGNFYGSGVNQFSISSENIFKGFDPQSTIKKYLSQPVKNRIKDPSTDQSDYFISIGNTSWFGLWKNGTISGNSNKFNFDKKTKNNIRLDSFNVDRFGKVIQNNVNFNNVLWEDGVVNNPATTFDSVVFLKGEFLSGVFKNSLFNPYVERTNFEKGILSDKKFKFELDKNKSIWKGGTFDGGVFYFSEWERGLFKKGTMVGGRFQSGISEYMSAFSVVWEDGRFRNGNWYGANFTKTNEHNKDSAPNPFDYLHEEYQPELGTPFVGDILSNNSLRIQDDRIFTWNTFEELSGEASTPFEFSSSNHSFGSDTDSDIVNFNAINNVKAFFRGDISTSVDDFGTISLTFSSLINTIFQAGFPVDNFVNLNFDLIDSKRIPSGGYELNLYTDNNNEEWDLRNTIIENINFKVLADVYDDSGNQIKTNKLIKQINSLRENDTDSGFIVEDNEEYNLKIELSIGIINTQLVSFPDVEFFTELYNTNSEYSYDENNNTLGGSIVATFSGDYLNSEILTQSQSFTFSNFTGLGETSKTEGFQSTLDVPTDEVKTGGVFTQFGNGVFQKGIWENGVWNNGYRGEEYGYFITPGGLTQSTNDVDIFVEEDDVIDGEPKYRTEANIYFNKIDTSFRISNNTWRISLVSAIDINTNGDSPSQKVGKLSISDRVLISNVSVVDINNNRKPVNDILRVIDIVSENEILLEYVSDFPIKRFEKSSDRHLIMVNKNVWKNGAFLNGLFQGIARNIFVRGNPNTTLFENTHFGRLDIKGGKVKSERLDLSLAFGDKKEDANSLSPEFKKEYNEQYHTTLIEMMDFDADENITIEEIDHPKNLEIKGDNSEVNNSNSYGKTFSFTETNKKFTPVYEYNTDLDLVYQPEEFSSVYNPNIFNNLIINKNNLNNGSSDFTTELNNIPAGYITYDVLKSNSIFRFNRSKSLNNTAEFKLSLGSDFRRFNQENNIDFSEEPNGKIQLGIPSNDNIIESGTYGLFKAEYSDGFGDGIFGIPPKKSKNQSQFIHNEFMYNFIEETEDKSYLINSNSSIIQKNRYHIVEIDLEFKDEEVLDNPFTQSESITISTTYSYSGDTNGTLPKLSIGQYYNEFIENDFDNKFSITIGSLSPYDNDMIPFIDGRRQSEINNFGKKTSKRYKIKTYIYNNFDGVSNSLRLLEKDFETLTTTQSTTEGFIVNTPVYYSFSQTEIDSIPFFKYQDFESPISEESFSDWNFIGEQKNIRKVDRNIKVPFYATSVEIDYQDDNFSLTDNLSLKGGSNIGEKESQTIDPVLETPSDVFSNSQISRSTSFTVNDSSSTSG